MQSPNHWTSREFSHLVVLAATPRSPVVKILPSNAGSEGLILGRETKIPHVMEVRSRFGASLVAQMVKNLPAMQETRVRSLNQEDPLEKEMATHSSILAWKIPWTEKPSRVQPMGLQRVVFKICFIDHFSHSIGRITAPSPMYSKQQCLYQF